jgi:hypothetical protein
MRVSIIKSNDGHPHTYRSRQGRERTIQVDREWEIYVDDTLAGHVRYRMISRPERPTHRKYVDDKWDTPIWEASPLPNDNYSRDSWECRNKQTAIEDVVEYFTRGRR